MLDLNSLGYVHVSHSVKKAEQRINDIRDGKVFPIITSSDKENEELGGYYPGEQITIAGRTGSGKTAFALIKMADMVNWKLNPKWEDKIIILYDSWEMPDWRNVLRFYSRFSATTVAEIINYQKHISDEKMTLIKTIGEKFSKKPIYISQHSKDVNSWFKIKKKIQDKYPGHTLINFVDHTRLVTKSTEKSEEALLHSLVTTGVKLKNEIECINIFLSQMNRNIETNASSRNDIGKSLPQSSDIFGSDSVYQSSDVVLALHRPGSYGLTEFNGMPTGIIAGDPSSRDNLLIECILKQRDGATGNLILKHDLAINRLQDVKTK
jgi:replicative DNA helicase